VPLPVFPFPFSVCSRFLSQRRSLLPPLTFFLFTFADTMSVSNGLGGMTLPLRVPREYRPRGQKPVPLLSSEL